LPSVCLRMPLHHLPKAISKSSLSRAASLCGSEGFGGQGEKQRQRGCGTGIERKFYFRIAVHQQFVEFGLEVLFLTSRVVPQEQGGRGGGGGIASEGVARA
jgi:hypothetical protein